MRALVPLLTLAALFVTLPARPDGLPQLLRCGERVIEIPPRVGSLRLRAGFGRSLAIRIEPTP